MSGFPSKKCNVIVVVFATVCKVLNIPNRRAHPQKKQRLVGEASQSTSQAI